MMRIRKEIRQEAGLVKKKTGSLRTSNGLVSCYFLLQLRRGRIGAGIRRLRVKPDGDLRLAELKEQAVMPSATVRTTRVRCPNVS